MTAVLTAPKPHHADLGYDMEAELIRFHKDCELLPKSKDVIDEGIRVIEYQADSAPIAPRQYRYR